MSEWQRVVKFCQLSMEPLNIMLFSVATNSMGKGLDLADV